MASTVAVQPDPVQAMTEENLSKNLHVFKENMKKMPFSMRAFSLSLRSLYVDNAVGSDEKPAIEFRELRDDTRNDAMVYLKCLLPLSTHFVRSIKMLFEYFLHLDYEEWKESLPDIKKDVVGYKEVCEAMLKGHEELLVPLKKREDKAKLLMSEFEDLQNRYDEEIKKLKSEIENTQEENVSWFFVALSFVPVVGQIISHMERCKALAKVADKAAAITQSEINHRAAYVVETVLIPALKNFIDGLSSAAAFFSIMLNELQTFEERASNENPKKVHYKVMNKEAEEMNSICQDFYAVIPDVTTDFLAIPTEGTDQNYVDQWLEKQKKIIKEKCSIKSVLQGMLKAITDCVDGETTTHD